jgi:hypothetical protein
MDSGLAHRAPRNDGDSGCGVEPTAIVLEIRASGRACADPMD